MADDDWEHLVALPSRNWGSVSVQKLMDVAVALGAQPSETDLTFFQDDEGGTWYAVMAPPWVVGPHDAPPPLDEPSALPVDLEPDSIPDPIPPEPGPEWEVFTGRLTRPGTSRECSLCGRVLETSGAVEVHMKRDHGPASVACPDCGSVYATDPGMQRHRRARHPEATADDPTRWCGVCRRELATPEDAREHEQTVHTDGAEPLVCADCGWVFTDGRGLAHHRKMKHDGVPEPDDPMKVLLEPSTAPEPEPTAPTRPTPFAVHCKDCDYDSLFADNLNTHCLKEHGRRATPLERTPKATAR